jgi:hypothetical protein
MYQVRLISVLMALSTVVSAQVGPRAIVSAKIIIEGRPAVVQLDSRVTTTIRLPEPVNSVVLGDSTLFHAEYSPSEPLLVFVRSISSASAESNLVISTTRGRQFVLILRSVGGTREHAGGADLLVTCKASGGFFIEDTFPDSLIAETVRTGASATPQEPVTSTGTTSIGELPSLGELIGRQRQQPLSRLHGDRIRVSVGQVIEEGSQLVVLFSVVGSQADAVELVPPQVQLAGRTSSGIFGRSRWTTAQQLPVQKYVMSSRRLAAGGRVDGVVVFERPLLKQSTEELLLQVADSAAIDKPALAPISFRSTNSLEKDQ